MCTPVTNFIIPYKQSAALQEYDDSPFSLCLDPNDPWQRLDVIIDLPPAMLPDAPVPVASTVTVVPATPVIAPKVTVVPATLVGLSITLLDQIVAKGPIAYQDSKDDKDIDDKNRLVADNDHIQVNTDLSSYDVQTSQDLENIQHVLALLKESREQVTKLKGRVSSLQTENFILELEASNLRQEVAEAAKFVHPTSPSLARHMDDVNGTHKVFNDHLDLYYNIIQNLVFQLAEKFETIEKIEPSLQNVKAIRLPRIIELLTNGGWMSKEQKLDLGKRIVKIFNDSATRKKISVTIPSMEGLVTHRAIHYTQQDLPKMVQVCVEWLQEHHKTLTWPYKSC